MSWWETYEFRRLENVLTAGMIAARKPDLY